MRLFEWDENKSTSNIMKHGIDFKEAQMLWEDCNRIEFSVQTEGEQRFLTIGLMNAKHWTAVITYRELNIRIISVRRSRIEEVRLYEK
jgi:uncharacterized DUF497 family protein